MNTETPSLAKAGHNVVGIFIIHIILMIFVGSGLISSLVIFLISDNFPGIFSLADSVHVTSAPAFVLLLIERTFIAGWEVFLLPVTILYFAYWLYSCIKSKKLTFTLSKRSRQNCVRVTYLVPLLLLVISITQLPTLILFDGPIYGFHPLSPLFKSFFAIIVPTMFWRYFDFNRKICAADKE